MPKTIANQKQINTDKFAWYDMTSITEDKIPDLLETTERYNYSGLVLTPEQASTLPTKFTKNRNIPQWHSREFDSRELI